MLWMNFIIAYESLDNNFQIVCISSTYRNFEIIELNISVNQEFRNR